MTPADLGGAEALARAVSDPTSPSYRHFLTPAEWERRFSPSAASVKAVEAWLREQGIAVEGVSADRLTIEAAASAATVERAFGTTLGQYRRDGRVLRLAAQALKVPASISGLITGFTGIDQTLATPDDVGASTKPAKKPGTEIPQPEGFRNAPPCSDLLRAAQRRHRPGLRRRLPRTAALCRLRLHAAAAAGRLRPHLRRSTRGSTARARPSPSSTPTPRRPSSATPSAYSQLNQPGQPLSQGAVLRGHQPQVQPGPNSAKPAAGTASRPWTWRRCTPRHRSRHPLRRRQELPHRPLQGGAGSRRPRQGQRDHGLLGRRRRRPAGLLRHAPLLRPRPADGHRHRRRRAVLRRRRRRRVRQPGHDRRRLPALQPLRRRPWAAPA